MAIQKLYTIKEVAEITGLTLGTARQYVSNGVIPALYLGKKRVVTTATLEHICEHGLNTAAVAKALPFKIHDTKVG